jgi:hypothetical protein
MPVKPSPPTETWMDAQQYASLSKTDKDAIAAAVEEYENDVAAANKKLAETIATITDGKFPTV